MESETHDSRKVFNALNGRANCHVEWRVYSWNGTVGWMLGGAYRGRAFLIASAHLPGVEAALTSQKEAGVAVRLLKNADDFDADAFLRTLEQSQERECSRESA